MSTLKSRLTDDVKTALRAGEKSRLGTLRMAMAAIKQREVDDRTELDDAAITGIIEKMVKQRRESIQQYEAGNRQDLADAERNEIEILRAYLPEPLDSAALEALIGDVVAETGASSMQDMGRVMKTIRQRAAGRADMAQVGKLVRERLAN